jgi:ATP-binding cassette subfamily F protein 3
MFDPKAADPKLASRSMTELMKLRAKTEAQIEAAEAAWLEASGSLEDLAA